MRSKRCRAYLSFALFVIALSVAVAQKPSVSPQRSTTAISPMVLRNLGSGAIPLDGIWQFHTGDDPAWADPSFDDSQWEQLTSGKPWGEQGHASYAGFAWYRRHISSDLTRSPGNLAILIPHIDDTYELYWNGRLIGSNGKLPPHPAWYSDSQPSQTFGWPVHDSGVLAIRVWKAPLTTEDNGLRGGFEAPPLVGSSQAITAAKSELDYQWLRSRQFVYAEDLLYFIVALLGFLAWLRDRHQWTLLWIAGFAFASITRVALYGMGFPIPRSLADTVASLSSSIRDISLWFLLLTLLDLRNSPGIVRLTRAFAVASLLSTTLDGVVVMFLWPSSTSHHEVLLIDASLTAIYIVTAALPLFLVLYAFQRNLGKGLASRILAITAFACGMLQVVQNIAPQGSRYTHWTLSDRMSAPLFVLNGNAVSFTTLAGLLLLAALVFAVYRHALDDRRRQIALQQEFRSAQEVQQALIPEAEERVPGFILTSSYIPAAEVGGDFFQLIPAEGDYEGSTLVLMGDVSGKGLKAALVVALIVGAVRALAETTASPAEILAGINRRVCGRLQGGFVTCLVMRLDSDGNCVIANAGHPPPFLNHKEMETPGALPLGLINGVLYHELRFEIQAEDRLSLYTDGLLEARSESGEIYGFERVHALFARKPSAAEAAQAALDFGQEDDITILTLTRLEEPITQTSQVSYAI
ncbi:SpoIIE family protein phosphatase [Acidicapsa dinghuensis]|uniref:SpoIIE family protein phosphatase n=1 Tax=Acidicapsa dinghuensis TaxID=2218256 RepID=A0ABW1EDT6_9BACT|nr:SpoIIE family protein phosphatase [Acidicapsa dinghuensis]